MENRKLMEPGKWYREFDENGVCTAAVYDASYRKLLGYESEEEFAVSPENGTGMIHPDDEARLDALRRDCGARHPEGKDFDIEYRILTRRGYRLFHDYDLPAKTHCCVRESMNNCILARLQLFS